MAFCESCGHELSAGAKFCSECGTAVVPSASLRGGIEGVAYKCPQCGEVLDAFTAKCPSCGYELRGAPSVSSLRELLEGLQQCEGSETHKRGVLQHLYRIADKSDDASAALIREYPIPNTKEDLIEFLILAASNVDPDAFNEFKKMNLSPAEAMRSRAWMAKLDQAYQKASIVMGNDDEFDRCEQIYNAISKRVLHARRAVVYIAAGLAVVWAVLIAVAIVLVPK